MYVHDMSLSPWNHPDDDHLISAKTAFYVTGSTKTGSMGPTFASFSNESAAISFAREQGGKVLSFKQLTKKLLAKNK